MGAKPPVDEAAGAPAIEGRRHSESASDDAVHADSEAQPCRKRQKIAAAAAAARTSRLQATYSHRLSTLALDRPGPGLSEDEFDLYQARLACARKLQLRFEEIFRRYEKEFPADDEVDLRTGRVVVDNGHIATLETAEGQAHPVGDDGNDGDDDDDDALEPSENAPDGAREGLDAGDGHDAQLAALADVRKRLQALPPATDPVWQTPDIVRTAAVPPSVSGDEDDYSMNSGAGSPAGASRPPLLEELRRQGHVIRRRRPGYGPPAAATPTTWATVTATPTSAHSAATTATPASAHSTTTPETRSLFFDSARTRCNLEPEEIYRLVWLKKRNATWDEVYTAFPHRRHAMIRQWYRKTQPTRHVPDAWTAEHQAALDEIVAVRPDISWDRLFYTFQGFGHRPLKQLWLRACVDAAGLEWTSRHRCLGDYGPGMEVAVAAGLEAGAAAQGWQGSDTPWPGRDRSPTSGKWG
ncbi:hypothetical protein KEM52_003155 [Ascosphaera acerosa]|nr:hypothetical protein KEM52_003155 [Ascosphaera acerosa]